MSNERYEQVLSAIKDEMATKKDVEMAKVTDAIKNAVAAEQEMEHNRLTTLANQVSELINNGNTKATELIESMTQSLTAAKEAVTTWLEDRIRDRRDHIDYLRQQIEQKKARLQLICEGVMGLPNMAIPHPSKVSEYLFIATFICVAGAIDFTLGMEIFSYAGSRLTAVGIALVISLVMPMVFHLAAKSQIILSNRDAALKRAAEHKKISADWNPLIFEVSDRVNWLNTCTHLLAIAFSLGILGSRIMIARSSGGHFNITDMIGSVALVLCMWSFYFLDLYTLQAFVEEAEEGRTLEGEIEDLEEALEAALEPGTDPNLEEKAREIYDQNLEDYRQHAKRLQELTDELANAVGEYETESSQHSDQRTYTNQIVELVNEVMRLAKDAGISTFSIALEGGPQAIALDYQKKRANKLEPLPQVSAPKLTPPQPEPVSNLITQVWTTTPQPAEQQKEEVA